MRLDDPVESGDATWGQRSDSAHNGSQTDNVPAENKYDESAFTSHDESVDNKHETEQLTCSVCSKSFRRKGDLKSHMKSHRFPCKQCSASFTSQTALKVISFFTINSGLYNYYGSNERAIV